MLLYFKYYVVYVMNEFFLSEKVFPMAVEVTIVQTRPSLPMLRFTACIYRGSVEIHMLLGQLITTLKKYGSTNQMYSSFLASYYIYET